MALPSRVPCAVTCIFVAIAFAGCVGGGGSDEQAIPAITAGTVAAYTVAGTPDMGFSGVAWTHRVVDTSGNSGWRLEISTHDGVEALQSDGTWSTNVGMFRYRVGHNASSMALAHEAVYDASGMGISGFNWQNPGPLMPRIQSLAPDLFLANWFAGQSWGDEVAYVTMPYDHVHAFWTQESAFRFDVQADDETVVFTLAPDSYTLSTNLTGLRIEFDGTCSFPISLEATDPSGIRMSAKRLSCDPGDGRVLVSEPLSASDVWNRPSTWREYAGPGHLPAASYFGFALQDAQAAIRASTAFQNDCGETACRLASIDASRTTQAHAILGDAFATELRQWRLSYWKAGGHVAFVASMDGDGAIGVDEATYALSGGVSDIDWRADNPGRWLLDPQTFIDTGQRLYGQNFSIWLLLIPGDEPPHYRAPGGSPDIDVVPTVVIDPETGDLRAESRPKSNGWVNVMGITERAGRLAWLGAHDSPPWSYVD